MAFYPGSHRVALAKAEGAGGLAAIENPEGVDLIVTAFLVEHSGDGPGTSTFDAGIAANGTTSSDNLIDGAALDAAGIYSNVGDAGTNGGFGVAWGAGEYLTVSASADPSATDLSGFVYVEYIHA